MKGLESVQHSNILASKIQNNDGNRVIAILMNLVSTENQVDFQKQISIASRITCSFYENLTRS